jgi:hypothetical protein
MRFGRLWSILAAPPLALVAIGAASANDSVAESAAGGLVLRQSDDIDMLSEDLYVSADLIRVRYVFRNRRPDDVRVTVAFPLPDRDLTALSEGDAAWPADFATEVDGRPVAMQVERRALLGDADHSTLLAGLGVPIAADNIVLAASEAIDALPPEQQQRLADLGLVRSFEYDAGEGMRRSFEPAWTVRETWYWEQVFPSGRDLVVEHRYSPGAGASIGTMLAFPAMRGEPAARQLIEDYCVEDNFLAAVDRMAAGRGGPDRALLIEQRIRYILSTGANWRSPIGDFRLVVDKGSPDNIVSFCGSGLTRLDSTRFEMRRRNWRPDRDLAVLIIKPGEAD